MKTTSLPFWKSTVLGTAALALALVWAGCSSSSQSSGGSVRSYGGGVSTRTVRGTDAPAPMPMAPPSAPIVEQPVAPAVVEPASPAQNILELRAPQSDLVLLQKRVPANAAVGQSIENQLIVTALQNCGNVVVTHFIAPEATLIRTEPPASVNGRKLTWFFDSMHRGEVQNIRVWLRTDTEGALMSCSTLTAQPFGCVVTMVGKPNLVVEKSGPATAKLGDRVTYTITVRNRGSSAAENVVVTDVVPDGMSHESGQRSLSFDVGTLAPGEARQGSVTFRADQRGRVTNVVTARSANAGQVTASAQTAIVTQEMLLTKVGTREQYLGRVADYTITVSNPGDTALTGVTVTDSAPAETSITAAPGGTVAGNQATWRLSQLAPGERQSFSLGLRGNTPGTTVNRVSASSTEGLSANAQAETVWRGFAAILLEMVDDPDPLQIGDTTTYTIRVTNQGTAPDSNISITVNFPEQLSPQAAGGVTGGRVVGRTVTFDPLPQLGAKQVATWTVKAKAISTGDARVRAELNSNLLRGRPVLKDEATQVY